MPKKTVNAPSAPRATLSPLGQRRIVAQIDEYGCAFACAEMLFSDRGIEIQQLEIALGVPLPVDAPRLAKRMTALSKLQWLGGALNVPNPPDWNLIEALTSQCGSWAALLEPNGPTHIGHWVVVDGVSDEGVVSVRDPVGVRRSIAVSEFVKLWGYSVLVFERGE